MQDRLRHPRWLRGSIALTVLVTTSQSLAQPAPAPKPGVPTPDQAASADPTSVLLLRADALAKEVSALRGLPLRTRIAKDVVDKIELRRRLTAMTTGVKETHELAREEILLKHWGLIPRDVDYRAMVIDVLSEQVAGYYDSERKSLTLLYDATEEQDPEWAEMVLVHEIQHALQDQTFDLTKFRDLPSGEDDAAIARAALVEGDGVAVMIARMWPRSGSDVLWTDPDMARSIQQSLADTPQTSFDALPLVIREQLLFPYQAGFAFVADLRRQKSWRAVDDAFRRPPVSTEQILHPELYRSNEAPIRLPKLAVASLSRRSGRIETTWGELGFSIFLRSHNVAADLAAAAAAGWAGDRVSVVRADGATGAAGASGELGIARILWDSEADALEAYEASVRAMDAWIVGPLIERTGNRAAWLHSDGRMSWVEVRDTALVIAHAVAIPLVQRLSMELWRAMGQAPTQRVR